MESKRGTKNKPEGEAEGAETQPSKKTKLFEPPDLRFVQQGNLKDTCESLGVCTVAVPSPYSDQCLATVDAYCMSGRLTRLSWAYMNAESSYPSWMLITTAWSVQTVLKRTLHEATWKLFGDTFWSQYIPEGIWDDKAPWSTEPEVYEGWGDWLRAVLFTDSVTGNQLERGARRMPPTDIYLASAADAAFEAKGFEAKRELHLKSIIGMLQSKGIDDKANAIFLLTHMGMRGKEDIARVDASLLSKTYKALVRSLGDFKEKSHRLPGHYRAALAAMLLHAYTPDELHSELVQPVRDVVRAAVRAVVAAKLSAPKLTKMKIQSEVENVLYRGPRCALSQRVQKPEYTKVALTAITGIMCFITFLNLQKPDRNSEIKLVDHSDNNRSPPNRFSKYALVLVDVLREPEEMYNEDVQAVEMQEQLMRSSLNADPECSLATVNERRMEWSREGGVDINSSPLETTVIDLSLGDDGSEAAAPPVIDLSLSDDDGSEAAAPPVVAGRERKRRPPLSKTMAGDNPMEMSSSNGNSNAGINLATSDSDDDGGGASFDLMGGGGKMKPRESRSLHMDTGQESGASSLIDAHGTDSTGVGQMGQEEEEEEAGRDPEHKGDLPLGEGKDEKKPASIAELNTAVESEEVQEKEKITMGCRFRATMRFGADGLPRVPYDTTAGWDKQVIGTNPEAFARDRKYLKLYREMFEVWADPVGAEKKTKKTLLLLPVSWSNWVDEVRRRLFYLALSCVIHKALLTAIKATENKDITIEGFNLWLAVQSDEDHDYLHSDGDDDLDPLHYCLDNQERGEMIPPPVPRHLASALEVTVDGDSEPVITTMHGEEGLIGYFLALGNTPISTRQTVKTEERGQAKQKQFEVYREIAKGSEKEDLRFILPSAQRLKTE